MPMSRVAFRRTIFCRNGSIVTAFYWEACYYIQTYRQLLELKICMPRHNQKLIRQLE